VHRAAVISPFSGRADEDVRLEPGDAGAPLSCLRVRGAGELAIHLAIRHAVFVEEQHFFDKTDRDPHDDDPATVHVLGLSGQVAGGAVRLYPLEEPGLWKGDRLAVLPAFRKRGLGAPLVQFAVACAGDLGGRVMVAHVQLPNVAFFLRLGWWEYGYPVEYVGRMHQVMAIDLAPSR
jgi:putative N-acetyltransferase (TIGR04045 family)